jgi:peptidyl-prolyl cis-trans isomerase SurA
MSHAPRRNALFAAAAIALPLLMAAGALAQPRPVAAPPAPRVITPTVELPGDNTPAGAPAAAAPAASAAAAPHIQEGVAAIVNDDIVSTYDLRQRMLLLVATSGVRPQTQDDVEALQQEALRSLIDEHLQTQEIKRISKKQKTSDFIADDKDVDDEISDIAKQNNLNFAQMKQTFAASGLDIATLREQIRTQITWQRLVSGLYGRNVRVSDDQVSNTLQRMSNEASQTRYELNEIFIDATRAGGEDKAIAAANQLIGQLQQGAPFPAVARQFSSSPTAANGGDTGWITASEAQPEVAKVIEQMRPGQLSQPIPVSDGVYIIRLKDKQAASGQTMVSLKQAAVRLDKDATQEQVAAANAALRAIKPQIKGCDNIEQVASKTPGVIPADLGEADLNDLRGPFKEAAEKLQAGQVSDPIRTDVGLHLVAVCTKRAGGSKLPSRNDVSNRLYAEQLSVMSKRYLRDLRNSATIEAR